MYILERISTVRIENNKRENNVKWLVIIDELSLDDILQKIYFEAYSYEDLKDYVFSALRKVSSLDEFLDLLYTTIRDYSLVSYSECQQRV